MQVIADFAAVLVEAVRSFWEHCSYEGLSKTVVIWRCWVVKGWFVTRIVIYSCRHTVYFVLFGDVSFGVHFHCELSVELWSSVLICHLFSLTNVNPLFHVVFRLAAKTISGAGHGADLNLSAKLHFCRAVGVCSRPKQVSCNHRRLRKQCHVALGPICVVNNTTFALITFKSETMCV